MQATQASDHSPSQPASGVDLASQGSIPQNINQPSMVSPVIYCSQMSMPNTQQPQQLLAFQSPLPYPAPCMPGLTEQDLVRVAHLVKLSAWLNQALKIKCLYMRKLTLLWKLE